MRAIKSIVLGLCIFLCFPLYAQQVLEWQVDVDSVENRIDKKLYGFLLEHIYHSVSNGIWGENVWNRSFEELRAYGNWTIDSSGELLLDASHGDSGDFRIGEGKDYELTLEVQRVSGYGPVWIGVRDQNRDRMLTNRIYCYLGGKNNTLHQLQVSTGWIWHTPVAKTDMVDAMKGGLETGCWLKVKVRCQGNRISYWLDDHLLFDRMIEDCPSDGRITFGGSDCKVAFRNINVLPLGNSKPVIDLAPVRHWILSGEGSISVVHENVLNDHSAVLLSSSDEMVEIGQFHKFDVSPDDLLQGSLFLRGTAKLVSVRLMQGDNLLSEKKLTDISTQWKEFAISLPVVKRDSSATLWIRVEGKGELYIDQVSLMNHSSFENRGFRPSLTDAVKKLRPSILRWPGGSFSEQYHFENGIGEQYEGKRHFALGRF